MMRGIAYMYSVFHTFTHAHVNTLCLLNKIVEFARKYACFRGARLNPTEVRLCLTGAASEARYDAVFYPPRPPLLPPFEIWKESGNNLPAPYGRGASASFSARERLAICADCEYLKGSRCDVCGCFVALKARVPFAHCPMGKW